MYNTLTSYWISILATTIAYMPIYICYAQSEFCILTDHIFIAKRIQQMNCEELVQEKTYNKLASKSYFGYYEIFSRNFLAGPLTDINSQFI